MLILGTGWVRQELDSDLWGIWPRASILTLKQSLHLSGLSYEKNWSLQLCCQNSSSEDFISKKRLWETFVDWCRQFWRFLFALLCLLKKDCQLSNGLSGNLLLCSASSPFACTQTCYPHMKIHQGWHYFKCEFKWFHHFYTIFYLGVLIASSVFKPFREMERKLCKIQGILCIPRAHVFLGRHLKLHLYIYKVAGSSEKANKGCLSTVSSSSRSRCSLMTLTNSDPY